MRGLGDESGVARLEGLLASEMACPLPLVTGASWFRSVRGANTSSVLLAVALAVDLCLRSLAFLTAVT